MTIEMKTLYHFKFRNLNDFLLKMVKEKLYIASGKKLVKREKDIVTKKSEYHFISKPILL